jgi:hypothetical protein
VYWLNGRPLYLWHFSTLRSGRYIANIGFIAFHPLRHRCSQGRTIAFGAFSGLVLWLLFVRRLQSGQVEIVVFSVALQTLNLLRFARLIAQRVTSKNAVLQIMCTSERLTIGSNRSLCSLGRAKARPLTKTLATAGK